MSASDDPISGTPIRQFIVTAVPVPEQIADRSRKTRITILTKIHHEVYGEQPRSAQHTPYCELMETEEQAYERSIPVGTEWMPIDFGWCKDTGCSFLNVKNAFNGKRRVEPTKDEKDADASHVLEIGKIIFPGTKSSESHIEPICGLYVGQETVISPLGDLSKFVIRCRVEGGRYYVFAIPNDQE